MSKMSRKVRAIAAGGAVLGVGAAVTLAAWSDSEFAQGTFASGQFGIQGSADGQAFADHTTAEGALVLNFDDVDVDADSMQPGQTVTADYWLRTIEGGEAATVTFEGATGTDGAFSTVVSVDGTPVAQGETFDLDGTEQLSIAVTLDENQDPAVAADSNIVWQFDAAAAE